ncbi:MAG: tape measure protein [Desulfobulbaceae bacterium]|nr:tape measure protein [Desulfobulbaceae bacterium]
MTLKVEIDVTSVAKAEKIVDRSVSSINSDFARMDRSLGLLESSIRDLNTAFGKNTRAMENDIKRVAQTTKRQTNSIGSSFVGLMKTMKAAAIGYATVMATMALQEFIVDTVRAGVELDSLRMSFKAITGDAKLASNQLQYIGQTADKLGLNLRVLEGSYKDILAASKNTSLEGAGVRKVFTAISKASAVLGMSADDTKGSLRALSQMISKGNVQAEELRGQLGERLPGAFSMAAEAMGVTTMELNDMLENGEVLAEELLPKLAVVLEGRFGNAAAAAGQRAGASFERFTNSITNLKRAIGESGLIDWLAGAADNFSTVADAATSAMDRTDKLQRDVAGAEANPAALSIETINGLIARQTKLMDELNYAGGSFYKADMERMQAQWVALNELRKQNEQLLIQKKDMLALERLSNRRDEMAVEANKTNKATDASNAIKNLRDKLAAAESSSMVNPGGIATAFIEGPGGMAYAAEREARAFKKVDAALESVLGWYDKLDDKLYEAGQSSRDLQASLRESFANAEHRINAALFADLEREVEEERLAAEDIYKAKMYFVEKEVSETKVLRDKLAAAENASMNPATLAIAERSADEQLNKNTSALSQYMEKMQEASSLENQFSSLAISGFEAMGTALTDFVMTGEADFKSFASSIISEMVKMFVQYQIIKPMMEGLFGGGGSSGGGGGFLSGLFGSAHGNAVKGSGAVNSVVTGPTVFPGMKKMDAYATGGIVGEAGRSEGILPLTRVGADLGVKADINGGGSTNIIINVENNAGDKVGVEAETSQNDMGETVIGIVVDAALRDKQGFGKVIQSVAQKKR